MEAETEVAVPRKKKTTSASKPAPETPQEPGIPPEMQGEYMRLNDANNEVMSSMLMVGTAFIQATGFIRHFQYGAAVQLLAQCGQTDQAKLVRDFGEKMAPDLSAFTAKLEGHMTQDQASTKLKDQVDALLDGVAGG